MNPRAQQRLGDDLLRVPDALGLLAALVGLVDDHLGLVAFLLHLLLAGQLLLDRLAKARRRLNVTDEQLDDLHTATTQLGLHHLLDARRDPRSLSRQYVTRGDFGHRVTCGIAESVVDQLVHLEGTAHVHHQSADRLALDTVSAGSLDPHRQLIRGLDCDNVGLFVVGILDLPQVVVRPIAQQRVVEPAVLDLTHTSRQQILYTPDSYSSMRVQPAG